jgi:hypothetical protein
LLQLISDSGPTRDEIDFEFLGGNLKEPPILHTNIYINGQGGREQQFHFWFDPTADFHDYTLLLNEKHIVYVTIFSHYSSLFFLELVCKSLLTLLYEMFQIFCGWHPYKSVQEYQR